jgi:hypothetical protein
LRRRLIKPLRVAHDADQRLPFGGLSQQRQRGQPDEESIRAGLSLNPKTASTRCAAEPR